MDVIKETPNAASSAVESNGVHQVNPTSASTVAQIAEEVASGAISRDEAVNRLLADVLDSAMIQSAPKAMREGLKEALEALLETDPYLCRLKSAIGPREAE